MLEATSGGHSMARVSRRRWSTAVAIGITLSVLVVEGMAGDGGPRLVSGVPDSALVELGRRLFFDPAVSRRGMRSCADCHDPDHGYTDVEPLSRDDRGPTPRRSQTLIDVADGEWFHWHGEFRKL